MSRLRTLILSLTAAAVTLAPMTAASTALAHPPSNHHNHHHYHRPIVIRCEVVYNVYYRTCCDAPWTLYGGFYSFATATDTANYYRSQGYEAFVR